MKIFILVSFFEVFKLFYPTWVKKYLYLGPFLINDRTFLRLSLLEVNAYIKRIISPIFKCHINNQPTCNQPSSQPTLIERASLKSHHLCGLVDFLLTTEGWFVNWHAQRKWAKVIKQGPRYQLWCFLWHPIIIKWNAQKVLPFQKKMKRTRIRRIGDF